MVGGTGSMTDLDKLAALAAAATPGPWTADKVDPGLDDWNEETYGWWVNGPDWADGSGEFRSFTAENAAFIAACDPATIRDLVAAVRAEAPEPTGLDVERLARAMAEVWPVSFRGEFASDNPSRRLLTDYANRIAAEYARLTDSGATDGG